MIYFNFREGSTKSGREACPGLSPPGPLLGFSYGGCCGQRYRHWREVYCSYQRYSLKVQK